MRAAVARPFPQRREQLEHPPFVTLDLGPVVAAARQRAERRFDFATTVRSHAALYRRLAAGA